jgi:hypothetical protein
MVLEVGTHAREVNQDVNSGLPEELPGPDPAELEDLRCTQGTRRKDDFPLCPNRDSLARSIAGDKLHGHRTLPLEVDFVDPSSGHEVVIRSVEAIPMSRPSVRAGLRLGVFGKRVVEHSVSPSRSIFWEWEARNLG